MKTRCRIRSMAGVGLGLAALGLLPGCVADGADSYGYAPAPEATEVTIRADSDFYGPLSAYGRWETVGAYGNCWVPADVGSDWEPYEDGSWVSTDDGWYWETDEPWGWATYHYGRWLDDPSVGWCWIPGTQWAPAWVSWCDHDDYVGWAPLPPEGGGFFGGFIGRRPATVSARAYVFVPRREFLGRVRPGSVTRYQTAFGGRATVTASIATSRRGPSVAVVERASGRQVHPRPVAEVRRRSEAAVVHSGRWPHPRQSTVAGPAVVRPFRTAPAPQAAPAPVRRRAEHPPAVVRGEAAPASAREERRMEAPRVASPPTASPSVVERSRGYSPPVAQERRAAPPRMTAPPAVAPRAVERREASSPRAGETHHAQRSAAADQRKDKKHDSNGGP